jgi:hypothetical protein
VQAFSGEYKCVQASGRPIDSRRARRLRALTIVSSSSNSCQPSPLRWPHGLGLARGLEAIAIPRRSRGAAEPTRIADPWRAEVHRRRIRGRGRVAQSQHKFATLPRVGARPHLAHHLLHHPYQRPGNLRHNALNQKEHNTACTISGTTKRIIDNTASGIRHKGTTSGIRHKGTTSGIRHKGTASGIRHKG